MRIPMALVLAVILIPALAEYILTRGVYGHLYRYPYYGPYRQYYYLATYRPYVGTYVRTYQNVPVRQGDRHWDTDTRNLAPVYQRPQPQRQPNLSQNGGRGNSGGSRNSHEKCGPPQEKPCSNNEPHQ